MSEQRLYIPATMPGLNDIIDAAKASRRHGRQTVDSGYRRMKAQWEKAIVNLCRAQKIQPIGRARFVFHWKEKARRRDLDNIRVAAKFILDGLVSAGILQNDGWAHVAGFEDRFSVDKASPGVEVIIISEG